MLINVNDIIRIDLTVGERFAPCSGADIETASNPVNQGSWIALDDTNELRILQANDSCRFMDEAGLVETLTQARKTALRLTLEEVRVLWDELGCLSRKEELTDQDCARMRRIHEITADHPGSLPYGLLTLVFDERIEGDIADWLPGYFQEQTWEWHWWHGHLGGKLEDHCTTLVNIPWAMRKIRESEPYPEGWLPRSRRKES